MELLHRIRFYDTILNFILNTLLIIHHKGCRSKARDVRGASVRIQKYSFHYSSRCSSHSTLNDVVRVHYTILCNFNYMQAYILPDWKNSKNTYESRRKLSPWSNFLPQNTSTIIISKQVIKGSNNSNLDRICLTRRLITKIMINKSSPV